MSDYLADVRQHAPQASEAAVNAIVKYCGIALRNPDSSLVSGTDPNELATVRDGYAAKKLGLSPEAADAGIARVLEQLKGVHRKSRVTFYYLLADVTGTLDKLA
jgi:energy-coupling factor transporter ATP-binding protein EcfA2